MKAANVVACGLNDVQQNSRKNSIPFISVRIFAQSYSHPLSRRVGWGSGVQSHCQSTDHVISNHLSSQCCRAGLPILLVNVRWEGSIRAKPTIQSTYNRADGLSVAYSITILIN